jgi:hypothetical protein
MELKWIRNKEGNTGYRLILFLRRYVFAPLQFKKIYRMGRKKLIRANTDALFLTVKYAYTGAHLGKF